MSLIYATGEDEVTYKFFFLATIFNTDVWLATLAENLEWKMLDIGLYFVVIELASNETFCIENATE